MPASTAARNGANDPDGSEPLHDLVLSSLDEAQWPQLAPLARVVALLLIEARRIPAALKHLDLVAQLGRRQPGQQLP